MTRARILTVTAAIAAMVVAAACEPTKPPPPAPPPPTSPPSPPPSTAPPPGPPLATERVSVASNGAQAPDGGHQGAISGNGRYVAFASFASNLVAGDTNGTHDVFVHDRQTGVTERVSVHSDGTQGNAPSTGPAISDDGRLVAFNSEASTLVDGDANAVRDVFVHDRQTGTTDRVNVASSGAEANGTAYGLAISGDGSAVVFYSTASNLVDGDTNGTTDVFVHERQTGATERVSVHSDGTQATGGSDGPTISDDGKFVAFRSDASNLVADDTNGVSDVFVHNRSSAETERVSVRSDKAEANASSSSPSISGDGTVVAFESVASNLVVGDTNAVRDVFVHDRQTGATERVSVHSHGSEGNEESRDATISGDGGSVTFTSRASNLVDGDTNAADDVFLHQRGTGETERVSVFGEGSEANGASRGSDLSHDGTVVAFGSEASNLVDGDTNGAHDIFVRDRTI